MYMYNIKNTKQKNEYLGGRRALFIVFHSLFNFFNDFLLSFKSFFVSLHFALIKLCHTQGGVDSSFWFCFFFFLIFLSHLKDQKRRWRKYTSSHFDILLLWRWWWSKAQPTSIYHNTRIKTINHILGFIQTSRKYFMKLRYCIVWRWILSTIYLHHLVYTAFPINNREQMLDRNKFKTTQNICWVKRINVERKQWVNGRA